VEFEDESAYSEELEQVRRMLADRYEEALLGRVGLIDGEEARRRLLENTRRERGGT
jgi:hypothetical protein